MSFKVTDFGTNQKLIPVYNLLLVINTNLPILFVLYTADVLQLVKDHGLLPHAYADDTQILGVCRPSETDELQHRVSDCLDAVSSWMAANRLQLNHEKTVNSIYDAITCRNELCVSTFTRAMFPIVKTIMRLV